MTLYKWSQTAASNATADASINWQEGQAPSSVNDSARAMMASAAKYRDDIAGAIVTGGTPTAYTVASNQAFDSLAHMNGQIIAFTPHTTSNATVTLNVDGLGAKPLRAAPSTELLAGTLVQGTPYLALYNSSDAAFYLHGFYGNNPYNVPLGAGMDYWGSTAPNSAFAFPAGQAISRTTYATLFALIGTNFGGGDGSTTFNLPDKTGRVSAMKEAVASRLTSAASGVDGATIGSTGGVQSKTLVTGNLPPYTPSGAVATTITPTGAVAAVGVTNSITPPGSVPFSSYTNGNVTFPASSTFTGTAQGGTSTPFAILPPLIVCNYIIRVI